MYSALDLVASEQQASLFPDLVVDSRYSKEERSLYQTGTGQCSTGVIYTTDPGFISITSGVIQTGVYTTGTSTTTPAIHLISGDCLGLRATSNNCTAIVYYCANSQWTTSTITSVIRPGTQIITSGTLPVFNAQEFERVEVQKNRKRLFNIQRAKSAIKRALKLIDNVGFGDDVRVFLRGDEIEISHFQSPFKFVISKSPYLNVIHATHSPGFSTPYQLQLYTKSDVHIANLCVYMKDTPLLDQVLAIILYIKSGSEDSILQKANWHSKNKDCDVLEEFIEEHPQYVEKLNFRKEPFRQRSLFALDSPSDCVYRVDTTSNWIVGA
jgi:hypothetical protein